MCSDVTNSVCISKETRMIINTKVKTNTNFPLAEQTTVFLILHVVGAPDYPLGPIINPTLTMFVQVQPIIQFAIRFINTANIK